MINEQEKEQIHNLTKRFRSYGLGLKQSLDAAKLVHNNPDFIMGEDERFIYSDKAYNTMLSMGVSKDNIEYDLLQPKVEPSYKDMYSAEFIRHNLFDISYEDVYSLIINRTISESTFAEYMNYIKRSMIAFG